VDLTAGATYMQAPTGSELPYAQSDLCLGTSGYEYALLVTASDGFLRVSGPEDRLEARQ
jgi:hypothetical protein